MLRLSTVTIPATPVNVTLKFIRNRANTSVTLLVQNDVAIAGRIDLSGTNGGDAVAGTAFGHNGGLGGPGGGNGGTGGTHVPATSDRRGAAGLGPGGGTGGRAGVYPPGPGLCGGGGGGFATAGTAGSNQGGPCNNYSGPGGSAYGHPTLLPLVGGSGGGGGSGQFAWPEGLIGSATGGGGGGGGGAMLIAASGTIAFTTGGIVAVGGAGGAHRAPGPQAGAAGGGSGGGVRLVATTLTGAGTIDVRGGEGGGSSFGFGGPGAPGLIRLEAYTNTATLNFPGAIVPSVSTPGSLSVTGNPSLRIASVAGVAVTTLGGSYANPDLTLPASPTFPLQVVVEAPNVPINTNVVVRVSPIVGEVTTASAPVLAGTPPRATVSFGTFPLDRPSAMDAEATYDLLAGGWFDSPIKYAGEDVTTVKVATRFGEGSTVTYFTASGKEVPEHAVLALGLPR